MRIGAANLVSSHAIRIAFEVSILQILQSPPEKIAWYPAALAPPTTIGEAPRSEVV
ncbi:hypothetical protein AB395_00006007 (plasmid) [Sinorhizobium fredii CCBAU 45436]|nr:hypothetical protein AB395_00006007 [Sinorhizobium fredii CCBAU 45436]